LSRLSAVAALADLSRLRRSDLLVLATTRLLNVTRYGGVNLLPSPVAKEGIDRSHNRYCGTTHQPDSEGVLVVRLPTRCLGLAAATSATAEAKVKLRGRNRRA
jgi:hypothetical protein